MCIVFPYVEYIILELVFSAGFLFWKESYAGSSSMGVTDEKNSFSANNSKVSVYSMGTFSVYFRQHFRLSPIVAELILVNIQQGIKGYQIT